MARSICLELPPDCTPVVRNIAALFARLVTERCGVPVSTEQPGDFTLILKFGGWVGPEGFIIADGPNGSVRISGRDARGLLYGVGKFLRTARYGDGEFTPGNWRGASVPEKRVRGSYFATHFHNYYHEAPIAEVERYVEELALWGTNVVAVWFDMHHYTGIADPAAVAMLERLHAILNAAKRLGLGTALLHLANEAYAGSPEDLRADWTAGHDGYHHEPHGHYHVELCPSKPGATDLLLRWFDEKLAAFADLDLDYTWLWPYDQGGCTCGACAPWGANGFLKLAEAEAALFRQRFPHGKVILSTWYFDHFTDGEWKGLSRAFAQRPTWVDYLLADDYGDQFPQYPLTHGVPGGLPMVSFPEISMYACCPWGGFGANPFPAHLQALWDSAGARLAGGFPYSEGIFEDINKAICAQLYWSPNLPARETLEEYIAYEFSPAVVKRVSHAIDILERSLPRTRQLVGHGSVVPLERPDDVEDAEDMLREVEAVLPDRVKRAWRWRILFLRAQIDAELARHGGEISDRCEAMFREITDLFYAHCTGLFLQPPSKHFLPEGLADPV